MRDSDRRALKIGIVVAIGAAALVCLIIYSAINNFDRSLANMRRRHLEATGAIDRVYAWHRNKTLAHGSGIRRLAAGTTAIGLGVQ